MRFNSLYAAMALALGLAASGQSADLIYVTMANSDKVLSYDVSLSSSALVQASEAVFVDQGLSYPLAIALDANGNVHVANYSANPVKVYSGPNTLVRTITGNSLNAPFGMTIDSTGNI